MHQGHHHAPQWGPHRCQVEDDATEEKGQEALPCEVLQERGTSTCVGRVKPKGCDVSQPMDGCGPKGLSRSREAHLGLQASQLTAQAFCAMLLQASGDTAAIQDSLTAGKPVSSVKPVSPARRKCHAALNDSVS